ncbi:YciI family protein [Microbacterium sp.]|uniref:YciI family protein n=1 Tax=Microbacterium sp. TaxID=51671 RepID=UPI003C75618B
MQFLFLINSDPDAEVFDPVTGDPEHWLRTATEDGSRLSGGRCAPADETTTVRIRNGCLETGAGATGTDRDDIGGFDLITANDIEQAIDIAARHPMSRYGRIELRPITPM